MDTVGLVLSGVGICADSIDRYSRVLLESLKEMVMLNQIIPQHCPHLRERRLSLMEIDMRVLSIPRIILKRKKSVSKL